jgi:hypothetical protein
MSILPFSMLIFGVKVSYGTLGSQIKGKGNESVRCERKSTGGTCSQLDTNDLMAANYMYVVGWRFFKSN